MPNRRLGASANGVVNERRQRDQVELPRLFRASNGHEVVPSSPLVPRNDPTLMFTNAGMVQFKNVFTGLEKRPYARATTSQKCVRAGGKHNDLDNVGYTARHHTFFEMLGNFSFGDYFKDRAIELAWNLVTKEFGLPKDRLTASPSISTTIRPSTCGRRSPGCPRRRIIRIAGSDNFWAMGDTGPCGPCSEIFYDHGDADSGRPARLARRRRRPLHRDLEPGVHAVRAAAPAASASTCRSPRSTPAWGSSASPRCCRAPTTITRSTCSARSSRRVADLTGVDPDGPQKASHRVIADHLRASAFLIADGVLPSNEGRGYVLRRIMRRAMRHAELLGAKRAADVAAGADAGRARWARPIPSCVRAEALITETLQARGDALPQDAGARACDPRRGEPRRSKQGDQLKGETAFTLYDTYGFPLDLTQDALRAARHRGRYRRLQRRHGAPAREGARLLGGLGRGGDRGGLVRAAREASARPSSSATRPRAPRAWWRRWCATARRSPS